MAINAHIPSLIVKRPLISSYYVCVSGGCPATALTVQSNYVKGTSSDEIFSLYLLHSFILLLE